jgi:putative membrane protein
LEWDGGGRLDFMTVLWVVVIGGIVWAVAALFPRGSARDQEHRDTPEEILDRRFAQGELDAESYRELREELRARSRVRS